MDTGASKNYLRPFKGLTGIISAVKPFKVNSIHGSNTVDTKCCVSTFGVKTQFFRLPQLQRFDGIIGLDLLKQVGGVVDLKSDQLIMNSGSE